MALKSFKIVGLLCVGLSGCSGDAFTSAGDGPDAGSGSGGSAVGGDGGVGGSGGSSGSGGGATGGSGTGGSNTGGTGGRAGASGASGASGNTELSASDYDQACTFDSECALVAEGDQCGCTGCANAAISSSAVGIWEEDASNIQCSMEPGGPTCTGGCAQMLAACAGGTCTVRPPLFIEASNYDDTCATDSDCQLIYTGEVCSACRCGTAAINSGAYEQYLREIEGVVCAPGPSPCDCAPLELVSCEVDPMGGTGTCAVGL